MGFLDGLYPLLTYHLENVANSIVFPFPVFIVKKRDPCFETRFRKKTLIAMWIDGTRDR